MADTPDKPTPGLMSYSEYARSRGVHLYTVQAAIKSGRLTPVPDENGKPSIDPVEADAELAAKTDPTKRGRRARTSGEAEPHAAALAKSRAEQVSYQAKLRGLEYKEKKGSLVSAARMKDEWFKIARTVRDQILALPDRLAARLAAETNVDKVHEMLREELTQALASLSRSTDDE